MAFFGNSGRSLGDDHQKALASALQRAAKDLITESKSTAQEGTVTYIRDREQKENNEREEVDSDIDSDDELLRDPELEKIRQDRLSSLHQEHKEFQELRAKGHGEYREIVEEEFLAEVTGSTLVVCSFYHRDFERCKIIDMHMQNLAPLYLRTKFIRIDAEKTPFFVGKLQIRVLPCVVMFQDGVAIDRIVGFDELSGSDQFPTTILEQRLGTSGVLGEDYDQEDLKSRRIEHE